MQVTFTTFTLLVAALLLQAPAQVATPPQLWQFGLQENVRSASIARNAACVAAVTASQAIVLDDNGKQLWSAPLWTPPRPVVDSRVAVSPKCDWLAVFTVVTNSLPNQLQVIRRDGFRKAIPIENVGVLPYVRRMNISPDGESLAVGLEDSRLWLMTRDGNVRLRIPTQSTQPVEAEFTPDGQHLILTKFFGTGLMNLNGEWIWKSESRELASDRNLSLFAGMSAPMHGSQFGDTVILDAKGNTLWRALAWDATVAVAPNGSFIAFGGRTEKPNQSTVPPFPVVPELNDTPEIWLRDRTGKVLAHREFDGTVFGVSSDSTCIVMTAYRRMTGLNRQLAVSWSLPVTSSVREPFASNILIDVKDSTVSAYRIPTCK